MSVARACLPTSHRIHVEGRVVARCKIEVCKIAVEQSYCITAKSCTCDGSQASMRQTNVLPARSAMSACPTHPKADKLASYPHFEPPPHAVLSTGQHFDYHLPTPATGPSVARQLLMVPSVH